MKVFPGSLPLASSEKIQRSDWVWLATILTIAVVLRSINLNSGLWYDEIMTLVDVVRLPAKEIIRTSASLNNHILFSLQAKAAIALFGESAWALRLPAMLFGVLGVAALWWLARAVVGRSEANIVGMLLAVSYHHVWFSQNARGYTEIMFWSIVGTLLFMRGLDRSTWKTWITYAIVLAIASYTHLSAIFFFAAHGLVYVTLMAKRVYDRRTRKPFSETPTEGTLDFKPLAAFALGLGLAILCQVPVLGQISHTIDTVHVTPSSQTTVRKWKSPAWTFLEIGRNVQDLGVIASAGLPAVLILTAIGAFSLGRKQPVLPALLLLNIPLTLLLVWGLGFRIWPRYFFIDLGFIFICVVRGVFDVSAYLARTVPVLKRSGVSTEAWGLIASSLAVCCSLFLLPRNYSYPKQDFLGAREFVESARSANDVVTAVGLAADAFSKYYAPNWRVIKSWPEIEHIGGPSSHTWVVYTSPKHVAENYPDVMAGLAANFDLVRELPGTLGDGSVLVYRSRALSNSLAPQE